MIRVAEHVERSDTGRQRRGNEDSFYARSPLFVLADGMGGAQAGEVASRLAIEAFQGGLPDAPGEVEERLAGRVSEANRAIHQRSLTQSELAGMGTTCTAIYVGETEVSIAHVGDSRAYRLRDGVVERMTRDHSLVGELVDRGKLTAEEAEAHPQRSIITRALGPEEDVAVDTSTVPARHGDVYLLCSDGLTDMVGEAGLAPILTSATTLADIGRALVDAANEAGGRDNITVVLVRLEEVGGATSAGPPTVAEQATGHAGAGSPSHDQVRAAVADAEAAAAARPASPAPVARTPRPIERPAPPRRRRVPAWVRVLLIVLVLLTPIAVGGVVAIQSVYFVGTDGSGRVALFRGLPYSLPAGVNLYTTTFVSGVPAAAVPSARRKRLLDHKLRSHDDAADLVRQLEEGKLVGDDG